MRRIALVFLCVGTALLGRPAAAADEGFDFGEARDVRVSGRIVDVRTGAAIPEARVAIETSGGARRATSGPDGTFAVTADSSSGVGELSIVFSHVDYQEKYLETVLRGAFHGTVEAKVMASSAHIKARKVNVDVGCGGEASVPMETVETAPVRLVCDGTLHGIELEVRGNTIAVLGEKPFTMRIESGRLSIRDSQNTSLEVRVTAVMHPR